MRDHPTMRQVSESELFRHSVDGVLVTSPDGTIHHANPAARQMLGWTQDELRAMGRGGLADPGDPRWAAAVAARDRDGRFRGLLRMRRADGSLLEVDLSTAVFNAVDGSPAAYVMFRDASMFAGVAEQAATVAEVVESISDAFFAVDQDWALRYVNTRAQQLLRATWPEAAGTNLWEVSDHPRGTVFEEHLTRVMTTREPVAFDAWDEHLGMHAEVRAYPLRGGGVAVYFADVTERRAVEVERDRLLLTERQARTAAEDAQVELRRLATHDELTGLLNRTGLLEEFRAAAGWESQVTTTVVFVDLDRFKMINDSLGHSTGDHVLAAVGSRLAALVPDDVLLARFGGDEFVLILFDAAPEKVDEVTAAVLEATAQPVRVRGQVLQVAASAGISRTDEPPDLGQLLREADSALYRAKDAGRRRAVWFDESLHAELLARIATERELREGIGTGQLVLHYQPAFDLASGAARHVEVLVRWHHPRRGLVPPGQFIGVAEESDLIESLGRWVLGEAVRQAARWSDVPDMRVWVNVSPRQLSSGTFAQDLEVALGDAGVPADRFGIEVTESTLDDDEELGAQVRKVRALGVQVAIDDFGTGYSSLARLTRAPVDIIKVDRSFVAGARDGNGYAVLNGIVSLAHALGATVIAEGVETFGQLEQVVATGCDSASGYLLARPVASGDVRWHAPSAGGR